ncbi:MAG: hypothetical protein MJ003_05225 [Paludibacteraceae bacterium]|nr:hypothetical protein [Paludibacteraceae bacterium]
MKTKTTTFLWLCGILTALFVTQSAFAVDVRPGSEYIGERIIRDSSNPNTNPYPMALTITTLANGNVRFSIAAVEGDETTVTWNDQGLVHDSGDAQLWFDGSSHPLKDYFSKDKAQTGKTSFELIPSKAIPAGSVIIYKAALQWKYGNQTTSNERRNRHDYLIYTYGTDTSNSDVTAMCNMHVTKDGANDAYITASTDEDGKITFTISNEAGTAYFRSDDGGGMNAEAMILRSNSDPSWMGKNMSNYFDRTAITNNVDNIPQNQNIVFTPKSGVTVPEDLEISFCDTQIAWRIGNTSAWNMFPWRYKYNTGCSVGKTIKAAAINIAKYTADITLDKSKFYDDAAYKIKIKEEGGTYSYVSGGPFSESDFPFTLTNLSQGTAYNVVIEGAYPDFDNPEDEQSSNTVKFTTIVSGSEVCDRQFVNGANSVGVSLETLPDGSLAWTITSSIPEGATWKAETWAAEANSIYVNGTQGATYFNNPVITADGKSAILTPKQAIPENAVITLQSKKIVWYNAKKETVWIDGGTQFDNFTYTYGKYCCALGALRLQITDINRSSANVYTANGCIADDGLDYVYRFKYKKRADAEYTVIDGFNSVYPLSGLQSGTQYDIVLETAYPSFDNPERYEVANASFSTLTNQSDVCDLEFTSGNSTAAFSFVTAENGNMELIIGGTETNYEYRNKPSIDKFQVNGAAASTYFNATYLSDDKTKIILPLKTGSAIKSDDVVKFNNGTLEWKSNMNDNAYVENKSFTTRYNTSCCTEGKQLTAEVTDAQYNSASIKITDPCLDGKDYVYRLRYRMGGKSPIYTTIDGRPTDGVYKLTGLLSATDYEAIAEAAYPSFESPTLTVEQSVVNFTTLASCGTFCDVKYTNGESTIGISVLEYTNGNIGIVMASPIEATTFFNGETSFTDINNYKINTENASNYFEAPVLSSDKKHLSFVCKNKVPANSVLHFNGTIVWTTPSSTNNFINGATLDYSFGRLAVESIEAEKNSAVVTINNRAIESDDYQYRLKYKRTTETDYTVTTELVGKTFTLSNLLSGAMYDCIVEAAYPSFEQQDVFESCSKSFTTVASCGTFCDEKYTNAEGTSTIGISVLEYTNGNIDIVMASPTDATTFFKNETPFTNINNYKVNTENASNYFETPVLSADKKHLSFVCKNKVPANSVLHFNETIVWITPSSDNNYMNGATIDYTFGRLAIESIEAEKNSAVVTINNRVIESDDYQYRLKYKKTTETDYTITTEFVGKTFTLSNLLNGTEYECIVEVAYPSFEQQEIFESVTGEFTTKSYSSEACEVMIQNEGKTETCYISMETDYQGNLVVSISGDEGEDVTFRTDGASIDENLAGYKVISNDGATEEDASEYFNTYIKSEDKKSSTFKLKADKTLPQNAIIKYFGTISWSHGTEVPYATSQTISHTYGTWCCEAVGFKIVRCEGTSPTTAIVRIDNLCISDADFKYQYSLKKEGEEYGEPQTFPLPELTLSNLEKGATYYIKVEAAYPNFDNYEIYKSDEASFETTSLEPAPVPTYPADVVTSVYSSTYGTQTFVNWMYYSNAESVTDVVLSSTSTLKKFDMKGGPGQDANNGAMIEIAEGDNKLDLKERMFVRFDMFISEEDAETAPYVSMNIRNADGAQDKWIQLGKVTPNEWNTFTVDINRFVTEGDLGAEKLAKSLLIVPFADPNAEGDDRFPSQPYTFYLDNLLFYTYPVKIGTQYYETLTDALEAVQDGETIDLLASVNDDLVVDGKSFNVNANGKSVNNATISETGSLTLTSDINIKGDFILKSGVSESGSLFADENSMTVVGNAYFDKQFEPSSKRMWYSLSLPFDVKVTDMYNAATEAHENLAFDDEVAITEYNSYARANGETGWQYLEDPSTVLKAGTTYHYIINHFAQNNNIRFKAANKAELFADNTIPLTYYTGSSSDETNFGWNGIGNNQLCSVKMSCDGVAYGLVYQSNSDSYNPYLLNDASFNSGTAVFLQSTNDEPTVTLSAAQLKSAEIIVNPFKLNISGNGASDYCYVSASTESTDSYNIGKDLVKMGTYKSGNYVSMWLGAYGLDLSCADLMISGGEAYAGLGIYAPKAGNYKLFADKFVDGQNIILTKNGVDVFDFANGEYEFALAKGINSGYGIRIEVEDIPTVAEGIDGVSVYAKDGYIHILGLNGGVEYVVNNMFYNVASGVADGSEVIIGVQKGTYIVEVGESNIKIIVD